MPWEARLSTCRSNRSWRLELEDPYMMGGATLPGSATRVDGKTLDADRIADPDNSRTAIME